jgi:hypothetical protein
VRTRTTIIMVLMLIAVATIAMWFYEHPTKTVAFDNVYGVSNANLPVYYVLNDGKEKRDTAHCLGDCRVRIRLNRGENRLRLAIEQDGKRSAWRDVVLTVK